MEQNKATNNPAVDVIVFGATGDLAARKLIPSLYHLHCTNHLPEGSRIIGAARSEMSTSGFHEFIETEARQHIRDSDFDPESWKSFMDKVFYDRVDLMDQTSYTGLSDRLSQQAGNIRLYYLSVGPSLFSATCDGLNAAGLLNERSRIAVEKPLGRDLESSREINDKLGSLFKEQQIYRIDHYLGKETVQNLLALRFGNSLFEPLWRAGHIRDVQITVAETLGIGTRGDFYDRTGAMRDMVQNHLLQLLCIIAMECPTGLEPDAMRDEKRKVLRALRPITGSEDIAKYTVRGQYRDGAIAGEAVQSYLDENGVPEDSHTETFVAICAHIDTWRWSGVPFYLRTGKRMQKRLTQIVVNFDPLPHNIFSDSANSTLPNQLVIQLQPEESISLQMMAKLPGDRMKLEPVELALNPERGVKRRHMEAYERVFMDAIDGNQTLFLRRDEVDAAWSWIDPILAGWEESQDAPRPYVAGTWGPARSSSLLVRNGVVWNEES
ncbi:MAG: glucose-6-phosphate dehydrogenase [Granulosicoccaceae bacterium]